MRFRLVCLVAALLWPAAASAADAYPDRRVTVVVTTAAGGLIDVVTRAVAQRLSDKWKQPVIVENRGGGGHNIGATVVAGAPADGYTLMATESGTFVTNPALYAKSQLNYDVQDFAPVAGLATYTQALIAAPELPVNTVSELIALAKAKPDTIKFGTSGIGSAPHMNVALFESLAGISMIPVHYRGAAPALTDLLGGHVDLMSVSLALSVPNYRAGKVKMLGVGSTKRFPQVAEVPTVAESGLPGYKAETWIGLFAPRNTPPEIVAAINTAVAEVLDDPDLIAKFFSPQMIEPFRIAPADFSAYIATDAARWQKVIREQHITIE